MLQSDWLKTDMYPNISLVPRLPDLSMLYEKREGAW